LEERFSANRLLCALSGSIGKGLAKIMDRTLAAQGFDREFIEKARTVAGHGGALLLTIMGAPEAALSVASSTAAQDVNLPTVKVNPVVADSIKKTGSVINADVKG
jgi:hypothetical protein